MNVFETFQNRLNLTLDDTIIDLMESISKEEKAISQLLNSEAEKIHAFTGEELDFPTAPSNQEILQFSEAINRILDTALMKEWLLYRKLETVIQLHNKLKEEQHPDHERNKE